MDPINKSVCPSKPFQPIVMKHSSLLGLLRRKFSVVNTGQVSKFQAKCGVFNITPVFKNKIHSSSLVATKGCIGKVSLSVFP